MTPSLGYQTPQNLKSILFLPQVIQKPSTYLDFRHRYELMNFHAYIKFTSVLIHQTIIVSMIFINVFHYFVCQLTMQLLLIVRLFVTLIFIAVIAIFFSSISLNMFLLVKFLQSDLKIPSSKNGPIRDRPLSDI